MKNTGNGSEAGNLGTAAGFGNHRRTRRACIDRKRTKQPRQNAAGSNPDEIAVDLRDRVQVVGGQRPEAKQPAAEITAAR